MTAHNSQLLHVDSAAHDHRAKIAESLPRWRHKLAIIYVISAEPSEEKPWGAFSTCLLLSSEDFLLAALDTVPGVSAALHQLLAPATEVPPESAGARGAFCKARLEGTWYADSFLGRQLPRLIVPIRSPLAATRGAPQ